MVHILKSAGSDIYELWHTFQDVEVQKLEVLKVVGAYLYIYNIYIEIFVYVYIYIDTFVYIYT